jgi:tryptophanyl-tRNA synthetase
VVPSFDPFGQGGFFVHKKEAEMTKKRVFSGTRATGRLHLGNYLGAVKGYIELQNNPEYDCVYMAVDLHTITTPYDHKNLVQATKNIIMDYLAAGLDPEKSVITAQSLVPEHVELAFLFSSVMSVARMRHLPTFKDKVKQHPQNVTMALLNYPVLMAADILAYKAELVPVGVDQEPHLEITREVARKMNDQYGLDFPEPQRFATRGEYVPSLTGEGKMSKSVEGSYINLMDDFQTIKEKVAKIPTDSGIDKTGKAFSGPMFGIFPFVELFLGEDKIKECKKLYISTGIKYKDLKKDLAEAIFKELEPIQKRRKELEKQPEYVNQVIKDGAEKARKIARVTLDEVKQKMGLTGGLK